MFKSEIKEFYNKNKAYCAYPFKEIYNDNSGHYKLCCYSNVHPNTRKYTTQNTTPFKYFRSKEMEEIRNKMLAGEKMSSCKVCYQMEEASGESYRTKDIQKISGIELEPASIGLKLRVHGSKCNLQCYMCHPHNSSGRRNEIKAVYGKEELKKWMPQFKSINYTQWNDILKDILDNIHLVNYIVFTGGEPLQLPKQWEMVEKIPEEHAKHITLAYDTNLTELTYKDHSIFDVAKKFQKVELKASCDHYGRKLEWIRYPINRKRFESNLTEAINLIPYINCAPSILNIYDLDKIYDYYKQHFGLRTQFTSIVRGPKMLSMRNINDKKSLLKKYEKLEWFNYIKSELALPIYDKNNIKMKKYCDDLSKHRNFNWRELWNEF